MPQGFVDGPEHALALWHQDDGSAAWRKDGIDVLQPKRVVPDVFQHVETNHGVHGPLERCEIGRVGEIAVMHFEIRALRESGFKPRHVLGIDVGGDVARTAFYQGSCQVADAASDFEHAFADEGAKSCRPSRD